MLYLGISIFTVVNFFYGIWSLKFIMCSILKSVFTYFMLQIHHIQTLCKKTMVYLISPTMKISKVKRLASIIVRRDVSTNILTMLCEMNCCLKLQTNFIVSSLMNCNCSNKIQILSHFSCTITVSSKG